MTERYQAPVALALLAAGAAVPFAASAYPEGAPWTALDDPAQACASCHFGHAVVEDSAALSLEGAAGPLRPGATYALTVRFAPREARIAGFLATFRAGESDAGTAGAGHGLESRGAAIRTLSAQPVPDGGSAEWSFDWTAPAAAGRVDVTIAANAANDDASPLGDVIHVRRLTLEVGRGE